MIVVDARVNWWSEYDNDPVLRVLVDKRPPLEHLLYKEKKLSDTTSFYYAELGGYVHFIIEDTRDRRGFSGRGFNLRVEGEKEPRTLYGPWASRASVANKLGFGPCIDVSFTDDPEAFNRGHTFTAGAISIELAEIACNFAQHHERIGVILERVYDGAYGAGFSMQQAAFVASSTEPLVTPDSYYFVPRKRVRTSIDLPRIDSILLQAYKELSSRRPASMTAAAKDTEIVLLRMERHFYKYFGARWKENLL